MEAQENKELDWIERIVGKKPVMMKPGVYVKEIDLSAKVPNYSIYDTYLGDQLWFKRCKE